MYLWAQVKSVFAYTLTLIVHLVTNLAALFTHRPRHGKNTPMSFYKIFRPLLFTLDPERAHNLSIKTLSAAQGVMPACDKYKTDPRLHVNLWGRAFPNPVGLAAGFDKNAQIPTAMLKIGFGAVEVGTVTPKPQNGNPKPRVFREPAHDAVINRLGFPNHGLDDFKFNIKRFRGQANPPAGMLGINIGMNKDQTAPADDYKQLIRALAPFADYLTVNISSPNTPGLRDLQKRDFLLALMDDLRAVRADVCADDNPPPIFVKFAPDLSAEQQADLAQTALDGGIEGLILGNTTLDRPAHLPDGFRAEKGGLSGAPLRDKSTGVIANFYKLTKGNIPLIGVGGISSGADAYAKIKAGASLVQLYSALIFKGPKLAHDINKDLLALMARDGYNNITDVIGVDSV